MSKKVEQNDIDIDPSKITVSPEDLAKMKPHEREKLFNMLKEVLHRTKQNGTLHKYFVEGTDLSIDKYPQYKKFIELSHTYKVKLITAGNRCGKTTIALLEACFHLLNWYPDWWTGKKWTEKAGKSFVLWIVSDTWQTSAKIVQEILFFEKEGAEFGTGMLPGNRIISKKAVSNVDNCWSVVRVKRFGGGIGTIEFKPSSAGRKVFQGTTIDLIVMDEEPPHLVYFECLARLMTSKGHMLLAFTPLQGYTEMIKAFEKANSNPAMRRAYIRVSWEHCPHVTQDMIDEMMAQYPPWQIPARRHGIPILGSGAIYPFAEDKYKIDGFDIPSHWNVWYALDVGWRTTAVIFMAENPATEECYVYDEIYVHELKPEDYIPMIKEKGMFMRGCVDPASAGSGQRDGLSIRQDLVKGGLDLVNAKNSVESGLNNVYSAINTNKLKIFSKCINLLEELSVYRRDENGRIVKEKDHACDAMRYAYMTKELAKRVKSYSPQQQRRNHSGGYGDF